MTGKIALISCSIALYALLGGCAMQKGATPRIIDLGNGVCQDTRTGTMWQKERTKALQSIEDAREYAENLTLGGHDDWRLPTVYELYDLYSLKDLHVVSGCVMDLKGNYWSDEKDGEGMVGAWEISDQCDPSRQYAKASKGFVRAVRP